VLACKSDDGRIEDNLEWLLSGPSSMYAYKLHTRALGSFLVKNKSIFPISANQQVSRYQIP
jgi:hypothetical protein